MSFDRVCDKEVGYMRFYVVGSTLTKRDPRDFDLLGAMDDDRFQAVYGLTPEQFLEEGRSGEWSPGRIKWKDECIGATRIIQELLPHRVPIDFKFIPESLLREHNKPISLRARVLEINEDKEIYPG